MNGGWTAPVDIYCERLGPGFWAEPLNAVSNLAFMIAAILCFVRWRRLGGTDMPALALIGVLTSIAIGSFLFHALANRWSELADVIPITVMIYVYFFVAMRRFFALGFIAALLVTVGFLAASIGFGAVLPAGFINGSGGYLPALAAILIVGALLVRTVSVLGRTVLLAGCILFVSLVARTVDRTVCQEIAIGTHFLWHLLNAVVLYLLLTALMRARNEAAFSSA